MKNFFFILAVFFTSFQALYAESRPVCLNCHAYPCCCQNAAYEPCGTCQAYPCVCTKPCRRPRACCSGLQCGLNCVTIAVPIAIIVGVAALVLSQGEGAHSHPVELD